MLTKGDLNQIREIIKDEVYSYKEGKVSIVGLERYIGKFYKEALQGIVSVLTQGDTTNIQLKKITKLLEQHIESTKQK